MSRKITFEGRQLSLFGTVYLGALIDALELHSTGDEGETRTVRFDFCGVSPERVYSYRGYYDHLAISWQDVRMVTVPDLVKILTAAIGARFSGYKGGEYIMRTDTPVWVDQVGSASSTAIVGLLVESLQITILTEYQP